MRIIYEHIHAIRGNLISLYAKDVSLGELAKVEKQDGTFAFAVVIRLENELVTMQLFANPRGVSTNDKVSFLRQEMQLKFSDNLLGRRFNGAGRPIDNGVEPAGKDQPIGTPSFNPVKRIVPKQIVKTNIPMIDLFNCLVKSQKIPIFSASGEPYNELLMRIANQTDADIVIIGGMGLTFAQYDAFIENAQTSGSINRTIMFIHRATDPTAECLLVPDMALAAAEQFALQGKDVLVLLTDMTAFADAGKEIAITMDQIPSNRGYPGSLYSDLASRYEKAVDIEGAGSVTIIGVTTMPGGDITHPIPDNTGYITEGQFYLMKGRIDPFASLSRLKQLVIGKSTREDHGDVANALIRLYSSSKKAHERESMGFKLSKWDKRLLKYGQLFESQIMDLNVNCSLEEALNLSWSILAECFNPDEIGIKQAHIDKYWPKDIIHS